MTTTKSFAELSGDVQIADRYFVRIGHHLHFIICTSALYPTAAVNFVHPNLAAWQNKTFETRAYWPSGRKKWFSHAGRDLYFVVPCANIFLVYEKKYSYVPVTIGGLSCHLNVSGGTSDIGWMDCVTRQCVHIEGGLCARKIRLLAEAAISPAQALAEGVKFDLMEPSTYDAAVFTNIVSGYACRKLLTPGDKVAHDADPSGESTTVVRKPLNRHAYLCEHKESRGCFRLEYKTIDWAKTAQLNGFPVVPLAQENLIGPVVPYAE